MAKDRKKAIEKLMKEHSGMMAMQKVIQEHLSTVSSQAHELRNVLFKKQVAQANDMGFHKGTLVYIKHMRKKGILTINDFFIPFSSANVKLRVSVNQDLLNGKLGLQPEITIDDLELA